MTDVSPIPFIRLFRGWSLLRLADWLVVAIAMVLPWSTSASSVLILLWLLAFLPTINRASFWRVIKTPAAAFPLGLCAFAILGMGWSEAAFADRLNAVKVFFRLVVLVLLFLQFQRSESAVRVLVGFVSSCTALLLLSWFQWFVPATDWRGYLPGVPVKEYVIQSAEFLICAFALAHLTLDAWQRNQVRVAAAVGLLALLFLANIVFVATGRGTAITLPLLAAVFSFQRFSWKGAFGSILIAIAFSTIIWSSSEYLRARVVALYQELYDYQAKGIVTSVGARLEFLRGSMKIISDAPMYGHGTGSTREQFRLLSSKTPHLPRFVTDNPHNQTLDVAVQLGLIGIVLLYAMWFAHMLLFWDRGTMAFVGFGVVTQNFVAGFFNSHLFEHSLGWLYVLGVGVLGGMVIGRTCKMSKLIADRYRPPG